MKNRYGTLLLSMVLFVCLSAAAYVETSESRAKAVISDNVYEFKPVLDGAEVIHDFVIQNTGNATLEIEKIETG
jgi:hypothetical protein